MDIDESRHLLQRTGFSAPPANVVLVASLQRDDAIRMIVENAGDVAPIAAPEWVETPMQRALEFKELRPDLRQIANRQRRNRQRRYIDELRGWWLSNLVVTENPLAARMTLFWQNHFTSSVQKVRYAQLMYEQHRTLMKYSLGKFGSLTSAMLRDPALLIYLDNRASRRSRPNENLARELLELFTLGEGRYSERDVRETARALTGVKLSEQFDYRFDSESYDPTEKTIFGVTGTFALEELVDLILRQPSTAEFIVSKLWASVGGGHLSARSLDGLASEFRSSDYDIKHLWRSLLNCHEFWDASVRGRIFKSPVEYVVGSMRTLQLEPSEPDVLVRATVAMQQSIYAPPTVKGWPGGQSWINARTLIARKRFMSSLLSDDAVHIERSAAGLGGPILRQALLPAELASSVRPSGHPLSAAMSALAYNLC